MPHSLRRLAPTAPSPIEMRVLQAYAVPEARKSRIAQRLNVSPAFVDQTIATWGGDRAGVIAAIAAYGDGFVIPRNSPNLLDPPPPEEKPMTTLTADPTAPPVELPAAPVDERADEYAAYEDLTATEVVALVTQGDLSDSLDIRRTARRIKVLIAELHAQISEARAQAEGRVRIAEAVNDRIKALQIEVDQLQGGSVAELTRLWLTRRDGAYYDGAVSTEDMLAYLADHG